jgi:hypothetical protein
MPPLCPCPIEEGVRTALSYNYYIESWQYVHIWFGGNFITKFKLAADHGGRAV